PSSSSRFLQQSVDVAGSDGRNSLFGIAHPDRNLCPLRKFGPCWNQVAKFRAKLIRDHHDLMQGEPLASSLDVRDRCALQSDLLREVLLGKTRLVPKATDALTDEAVEVFGDLKHLR